MIKVINYWVNNPVCVDKVTNHHLFKNQSHFIKTAILDLFVKLRNEYNMNPKL